jgi:hypothetical protein
MKRGLAVAVSATILAVLPTSANAMTAPDHKPLVRVCKSEDGSYLNRSGEVRYQRVCVWDARRLGNHRGHSFLLVQGPRGQHATYYRISHRVAKALTR